MKRLLLLTGVVLVSIAAKRVIGNYDLPSNSNLPKIRLCRRLGRKSRFSGRNGIDAVEVVPL